MNKTKNYIEKVIKNMPKDWVNLTTHRLDIYDENLAKIQFLDQFESLYENNDTSSVSLSQLPTAYDYIRLGHPLSCILEWTFAKLYSIKPDCVISFDSNTMPILSILRSNHFYDKNTLICYKDKLPDAFDEDLIKLVYGYQFETRKVDTINTPLNFNGSIVYFSPKNEFKEELISSQIDFLISSLNDFGCILIVNGEANEKYIPNIQHVRRRETIAMTPNNCLDALKWFIDQNVPNPSDEINTDKSKQEVLKCIQTITGTTLEPLVGSSGLSIQYAILMGLIHDAIENHKGKSIKLVVPPNCYGGTNDQARRVAAAIDNIEIVDLPVDGKNNMVDSIDTVLSQIAIEDAIPYIIAEIPTNPRVEVPNLMDLKNVLSKKRKSANGSIAIDPVFILDQTFCPNVPFIGDGHILSEIRTISFASGSKFPSGGKCTAGYCVGNNKSLNLMNKIKEHLRLCDNEATNLQYEILAEQMPSMNHRIKEAFKNTKDFVDFIKTNLPNAKINFVSEDLSNQGFMPSVFSLDLPTKGNTSEEQENYKRALNLNLINMMITKIPHESKYCVSYGQLKGCYWTIPATSTQGTTKEGDKDYIVRASLSSQMDLELHKNVFLEFIKTI